MISRNENDEAKKTVKELAGPMSQDDSRTMVIQLFEILDGGGKIVVSYGRFLSACRVILGGVIF